MNHVPRVKPYYLPPTLLAKQLFSALYYAGCTSWRKLPQWLLRSFKTIPVAAGAIGMGCIGYPNHPVWEMTAACNLRCRHCHALGGKPAPDELTTEQAKKMIRELARMDEFRMLVFTGGEPLVRPDLFELADYAHELGFQNVIATNGTLITPDVARKLRRAGVVGAAISIDAARPEVHDFIRNSPGAFHKAIRGLEACREAGMAIQINITAMQYNWEEIPRVVELGNNYQAEIMLVYQLVPTGRGENIKDRALSRSENEALTKLLARRQRDSSTIIEPVAAPQYWAYLTRNAENGRRRMTAATMAFKGCAAGWGLCYIKPNGDVWPCPFLPISGGNVREKPLDAIWQEGEVFQNLRRRKETLRGRCGTCPFNPVCGGCRGRAYALTGDYLAEDPSCFINTHGFNSHS
ncbi:MAG: radical SAM protein [Clostridia bacterium]|nr:radical SAM protein [Clostridia bacterium]